MQRHVSNVEFGTRTERSQVMKDHNELPDPTLAGIHPSVFNVECLVRGPGRGKAPGTPTSWHVYSAR
eukprot:2219179-Pyramimonas_sp.AAC.1